MTVKELIEKLGLEVLNSNDTNREINGGYAGDLLSWVMGRAKSDEAWVTIMTNVNVVAVASLVDLACVVIAENSEVDADVIAAAEKKQINLLRSERPMFELCKEIADNL